MDLSPIKFLPGGNVPAEVTRAQLLQNIERDLPWLEQEGMKDRPLVIVAGGPSLAWHWPMIASHGGDIMALNNAYPFLLDHGIEPDYFMMLDARPDNIEFIRATSAKTNHLIAGVCHPSIFDALANHRVTLYLTTHPETLELTAHIDKPKPRIAGTVGTVGVKALCMAYALGYRELHLYGYDSSYHDGAHHAFPQTLNDKARTVEVWIDKTTKYLTTNAMAHQAAEFCSLAASMVRVHGFNINLHCTGLLPDLVAHSNERGEVPLEIREQQKYVEMWNSSTYRKSAPGEFHVDAAIRLLGMKPGDSVIDFGCGTGRGAQALRDMGMNVRAVDFAPNCLDPEVRVPFVQACLWDLPPMRAKWGYCTDVMEHIPTEKVIDVLQGIRDRVQGCYFSIATGEDNLGHIAGRKLHLTLMTAEQWAEVLGRYWTNLNITETEGCVHVAAT